jgi:two-component system NarL family sensor kinase
LHARNRQLAVEEERHRLARDLHDSVTQSLYSIALAAQASLKLIDQARVDGEIRCRIRLVVQ